jgi:DNA-binding HxlR family transcriptional regulator
MPSKIDGKPIMDTICMKIVFVLNAKGGKLRFNELHEQLEKIGQGVSKPTLSDHLKHLMAKKIVARKVEDAQIVSYKLNQNKVVKFYEFIDNVSKRMMIMEDEKKILASLPIEEQLEEAIRLDMLAKLEELKTLILYRTYKREEDGLILIGLQNEYYKRADFWFVENSIVSEEIQNRSLEAIENLLDKIDPEDVKRDKL